MITIEIPETTVYEITTADFGGIRDEHVAYFSNSAVAQKLAKELSESKKWPHYVRSKTIKHQYNIIEYYDEFAELETINKRNAALSKLSKAEQELLGLI